MVMMTVFVAVGAWFGDQFAAVAQLPLTELVQIRMLARAVGSDQSNRAAVMYARGRFDEVMAALDFVLDNVVVSLMANVVRNRTQSHQRARKNQNLHRMAMLNPPVHQNVAGLEAPSPAVTRLDLP